MVLAEPPVVAEVTPPLPALLALAFPLPAAEPAPLAPPVALWLPLQAQANSTKLNAMA